MEKTEIRKKHQATNKKSTRCIVSMGNLELFEADEDNILARFIIIDETRVIATNPKPKNNQSSESKLF